MKNILRIFSSALLVIIILGGIVYAAPGIKMINIAGFNFFTFFQDNSANTGIDASYVHTRVNDSYFPSPADNFNYIRGKTFLGNDTVVVDASGNVWVGTTSPGTKLEVNGNIIAATPTATNHVTTKAYVDAAVVAAAGGGVLSSVDHAVEAFLLELFEDIFS